MPITNFVQHKKALYESVLCNDPSLESSPKLIELYKGDFITVFKTDNGVFARTDDEFSLELLNAYKKHKGSLLDLVAATALLA
jgi:hypothetical protein